MNRVVASRFALIRKGDSLQALAAEERRLHEERERERSRDRERLEQQALLERTRAEAAGRLARRTQVLFAIAMTVVAAFAVAPGIYGLSKASEADRAKRNASISQSSFLARDARAAVDRGDAVLGMLLALEALPKELEHADRPFVRKAADALADAFSIWARCGRRSSRRTAIVWSAPVSKEPYAFLGREKRRAARRSRWDAVKPKQSLTQRITSENPVTTGVFFVTRHSGNRELS